MAVQKKRNAVSYGLLTNFEFRYSIVRTSLSLHELLENLSYIPITKWLSACKPPRKT